MPILTEILGAIADSLRMAFFMFWETLWPLVFGFALSGAVQAFVSRSQMQRVMGDRRPTTLGLAAVFGAASSSCSYAASAMAKSLFAKGADFTTAMVFMLASTNLVGRLLAGSVPTALWDAIFLRGHGLLTSIEHVLVGPLAELLSFVCSLGNLPLAAALWKGSISFGGVGSFIFADLIPLPLLL